MKQSTNILVIRQVVHPDFQLTHRLLAFDLSCPDNNQLFEVTCTVTDGFDIKINESCRKSNFDFIDFSSSFVWGDSTKVIMDNPFGSTGIDVDQHGV